jgi:zinc protease
MHTFSKKSWKPEGSHTFFSSSPGRRGSRRYYKIKAVNFLTSLLIALAGQIAYAASDISKEERFPWIDGRTQVYRGTLRNGLKLIILQDKTSPTFAWQTWFGVGSRDEEPGKTGLAHLFEHMMFKGTQSRSDGEFDRLLDAAGAEGQNAFTSNDHTAYIQELPVESLDLIASLESERMRGLIVNDEAFSTEREVVQNERRMRTENSPDGVMYQEIFGLAFDKQNYRWPVIGYAEDLARMTAADARKFYDRWYQPANATIVVVGDVEVEKIKRLVEKKYRFADQSKLTQPIPPPDKRDYPKEDKQLRAKTKKLELNIQSEKLLIGWKIPKAGHPDLPALIILDSLATSGLSAKLKQALVDSGIASSVFGYPMIGVDPSLYLIGATLQPGQSAKKALPLVEAVFRKIEKTGATTRELEKAKTRYEYDFFSGLNSNAEIANFLGENETDLGDYREALKMRDQIQQVTSKDLQRVARAWIQSTQSTVLFATPKSANGVAK